MDTAIRARNLFAAVFGSFFLQSMLADGTFDAYAGEQPNWGNAGYPANFAALCEGYVVPNQQAAFDSNLAIAEQALKAGDLEKTGEALGRADSAGVRGPNETFYSASIKCQGEAKVRRLFIAWRDYYLARQAQGDKDIPLWVIAADGGKNGILEYTQNYDGNDYRRAVISVQTIIADKERDQDYGAFLLNEETAMLRACKDALPAMRAHAESRHTASLEAEKDAFNQPPSEQERAMVENGAGMASAMGMAMDSELILTAKRAGLSSLFLQDARDWNYSLYNDGGNTEDEFIWQELPSSKRAKQRGDTIMAKADDSSLSYASRDAYYDMAIDYYTFGRWNNQSDAAVAAKKRIEDDVIAEQRQAEANMQQLQADMEVRARSAGQARESMKKTEAETKSFNDEADALEAELGF